MRTPGRNRRIEVKRPAKYRALKRGLTCKIHLVSASAEAAVGFALSPGNAHDAPEGRKLIETLEGNGEPLLMDRAYEDAQTRQTARESGFAPVVPPKRNRLKPWEYDKVLYRRRNEIERYFLRIQRFRRVFTRYEKLDVMFIGVILFAIIVDAFL